MVNPAIFIFTFICSCFYHFQDRDPIERIRKLILSHEIADEKELKVKYCTSKFAHHTSLSPSSVTLITGLRVSGY